MADYDGRRGNATAGIWLRFELLGREFSIAQDGATDSTWMDEYWITAVLQEGVNGAVQASASDDFRETYGQTDHSPAAARRLDADLRAEWMELYGLQNELMDTAFTLENSHQAQATLASHCDFDLEDSALVTAPVEREATSIIDEPGAIASDH